MIGGEVWSAIQITTAAGICAVVDLHHEGRLPHRGFVRQEQIALPEFLANRFGRHYLPAATGAVPFDGLQTEDEVPK
jgi:saccharopine dehydrogenase-like NADP-dependent oxidoreductase